MSEQSSGVPDIQRLAEASEWVQRLAESGQDTEVFIEWQRWCDTDPANPQLFQQMQEVWDGFAPARVARVKSGSGSRVVLQSRLAQNEYRSSWRRALVPRLAASALLALGLVAWAWIRPYRPAPQAFLTAVGEIRHKVLDDGSRLDLGADSQVIVSYSKNVRSLRLTKGQAFFSVAHESLRPFIVHAGGLAVTAVGTAFDIRTAPDDTTVTVDTGRVRITADDGSSSGPLHADAGQRVRYSIATHAVVLAQVDPQVAGSWRRGVLQFQAEALQDVVAEVNRYAPRKIVLQDRSLAAVPFTGTISQHEVSDWLMALEKILPVTVQDRGAEGLAIVHRASDPGPLTP